MDNSKYLTLCPLFCLRQDSKGRFKNFIHIYGLQNTAITKSYVVTFSQQRIGASTFAAARAPFGWNLEIFKNLAIFSSEKYLLLKWYYDQKIISFFSSDFESVFA